MNMKTSLVRNAARCVLLAAAALAAAAPAAAATSPAIAIRVVPQGQNLDWGRLYGENATLNWAWPDGAKSAVLKIVANGRRTVLKETLSDTSVTSFAWTPGAPSEDTVYDATLTFDTGDVQSAQLYANPGAFGSVALKGWSADKSLAARARSAIPYRADWADGLAGAATFALDGSATALAYSDGYLVLPKALGSYTATLDFAVEPSSPAFSVGLDLTGPGMIFTVR